MSANEGELRMYVVAGMAGGALIYFNTVSRIILRLGFLAADFLTRLLHLCLKPFSFMGRETKKNLKITKNIFKMKLNYCKMVSSIHSRRALEALAGKIKGDGSHEEKTGRPSDKALHTGIYRVRGHDAAFAADSDQRQKGRKRISRGADGETGPDQRKPQRIIGV
jgi:hypothetical protein